MHSEEHNHTYYIDDDGEATWDVPEHAAWKEHHSKEHDRPFYHNDVSGETVWEKPKGSNVAWQVWHDEVSELR